MLKQWLTVGRTTMALAALWSVFDVLVNLVIGMGEVPRVAGNVIAVAAAGLVYLITSPRLNTLVAVVAAFLVLGFNVTWLVGNKLEASMLIGLAFAWVLLALLAWAAFLYREEGRRARFAATQDG
jgi:hypothetical protein